MVRFTLLEVNLDGAQFTANAPFSETDAKAATDDVRSSIEERLGREAESSGSGTSPRSVVIGLAAVAVVVLAARKLRSRRHSEATEPESEEPIIAD